ncbi:PHM/PNGase F domain-containing protein [Haematococcus lacustris]
MARRPAATQLAVLILAAIWSTSHAAVCYTSVSRTDFPYCIELGPNGTFSFAWHPNVNGTLRFAIDVDIGAADAWAGVGISEAGGMRGADLAVVVRNASTGALRVLDTWADRNGAPQEDQQQDLVLVAPLAPGTPSPSSLPSGALFSPLTVALPAATPGRLVAVLQRALDTCDQQQDWAVAEAIPQHLIWAYGRSWPRYHGTGARGSTMLTLAPAPGQPAVPPPPSQELGPGVFEVEVLAPNITIPPTPTNYLCTHWEAPHDTKYHIIRSQALIRSRLVHHIILFACTDPPPTTGEIYDCLSMDSNCASFTVGWAPGQDVLDLPEEAGVAMGSGPGAARYFALQVHYNNPQGITSPAPDTSGFRLTYTSTLRPNDVGVLTLGQTDLAIPPGQPEFFVSPTLCPGECTAKLAQPLTMFWSFLHMHETGKAISTRHFRNGTELPPVGLKRVWDFNHQGSETVPRDSMQLLPGDSLVTQCSYDSTTRTEVTRFGEGTMDEMCFTFIMYYPLVSKFDICSTNKGRANTTAICTDSKTLSSLRADGGFASAGSGNTAPSEEAEARAQLKQLQAAGALVNATWPAGLATPFVSASCKAQPAAAAARVAGTVPVVQAAGGVRR